MRANGATPDGLGTQTTKIGQSKNHFLGGDGDGQSSMNSALNHAALILDDFTSSSDEDPPVVAPQLRGDAGIGSGGSDKATEREDMALGVSSGSWRRRDDAEVEEKDTEADASHLSGPNQAKRKRRGAARVRRTAEDVWAAVLKHQAQLRVMMARAVFREASVATDATIKAVMLSHTPRHIAMSDAADAATSGRVSVLIGWFRDAWDIVRGTALSASCRPPSDDTDGSKHMARIRDCLVRKARVAARGLRGGEDAMTLCFVALARALGIRARYVCVLRTGGARQRRSRASKGEKNGTTNNSAVINNSAMLVPLCECDGGPGPQPIPPEKHNVFKYRDFCWSELHLGAKGQRRWVHVDVARGLIDSPSRPAQTLQKAMRARGSKGRSRLALALGYVVAVDSEMGSSGRPVKDVTKRYAPIWSQVALIRSKLLLSAVPVGEGGASDLWWSGTIEMASAMSRALAPDPGDDAVLLDSGDLNSSSRPAEAAVSSSDATGWACTVCTFQNQTRAGSTRAACAMCGTPAPVDLTTPNTAADENDVEDDELARAANNEPIPLSLGECKNHPRFCVEKHLKKYQVIYPFGPKHAVGTIVSKGRAHMVYPRTNLHTLRSKDRWRREFRQVREAEKPHKIVASRKQKPRRQSQQGFGGFPGLDPELGNTISDVVESVGVGRAASSVASAEEGDTIELYGLWQTDPYNVPSVKNGKIPRSKYGHVELWTPQHVPPGTVHINLPRSRYVARKLGIEHAPAMTGFERKSGRFVPILAGIVVLKDDSEMFREAYIQYDAERRRLALERQKRKAYKCWRLLIRKVALTLSLVAGGDAIHDAEKVEAAPAATPAGNASTGKAGGLDAKKLEVVGGKREAGGQLTMPKNKRPRIVGVAGARNHKHKYLESSKRYDEAKGLWFARCACGFETSWEEI